MQQFQNGDPYGTRTRVSAVETIFRLKSKAFPPESAFFDSRDSIAFQGVGELLRPAP